MVPHVEASIKGERRHTSSVVGRSCHPQLTLSLCCCCCLFLTFVSPCRLGASELHVIASVMGGMAAQEAIKLLTGQFVPFRWGA